MHDRSQTIKRRAARASPLSFLKCVFAASDDGYNRSSTLGMTISILIVDDDVEYAELLGKVLTHAGFETALCHSGRQALLEVSKPDVDGFATLHQLRRLSAVPVIMLTSRIAASDRVQGLDSGADDYICKPCDPDELISRIRAVLRRSTPSEQERQIFRFGRHRYDVKTQMLTSKGARVALTALEGELLSILLLARGRVVTREAIAMAIQDRQLDVFDRSLDVHISHLRTKLGQDGASIQTVRGIGYVLPGVIEGL
jgi:two-component system response regulator CpxR